MIYVAEPLIDQEEVNKVTECIMSKWISSKGIFLDEFEDKFSAFCETSYGVATSSGTTALHLALKALGISPGDEVIMPALTFVATANAVKYLGAKPVFIDSCPDTWCMDASLIPKYINSRTKAIIAVHLYGQPCCMDEIVNSAEKYNLFLVEDAAEAHGAEYKGRRVGSMGDIGCFSFYGNKIITTGEGGMCVTNNQEYAEKIRHLRGHAMNNNRRYWHSEIGFNYRMTNIQAAFGVAQMSKIDQIIEAKRRNATNYNRLLKNLDGITLPVENNNVKHVYWMYSILLESCEIRDKLIDSLLGRGIETRPFFVPMNCLPYFKTNIRCPIAEDLSERGINLPSGANLTEEDIEFIVSNIKEALSKVRSD